MVSLKTNARAVVISSLVGLVGLSCSSESSERVPARNGGPTKRECIRIEDAPNPSSGSITQRHARWNTTLLNEELDVTLGIVVVDIMYGVVDGNTHVRAACSQAIGVPKHIAVVPVLRVTELADGATATLDVTVTGPASRKGVNHPEANLAWGFDVRATGVDAKFSATASHRQFRPSWGKAEITNRDSAVEVESIAP